VPATQKPDRLGARARAAGDVLVRIVVALVGGGQPGQRRQGGAGERAVAVVVEAVAQLGDRADRVGRADVPGLGRRDAAERLEAVHLGHVAGGDRAGAALAHRNAAGHAEGGQVLAVGGVDAAVAVVVLRVGRVAALRLRLAGAEAL